MLAAIERAKTLPLARWLHALAIPEVGEETAHDLAKFHADIGTLANSPLLRGVIELDGLRAEIEAASPKSDANKSKSDLDKAALKTRQAELKEQADAVAHTLIESEFAQPSKKKNAAPRDAVVAIGPVAAKAVLAWFAGDLGQAVLPATKELGISPQGSSPSPGELAICWKDLRPHRHARNRWAAMKLPRRSAPSAATSAAA